MLDRRIKIRHLQCFVEICRARSMKSAAEKLNLTQPAISKTLKELEEILNVPLLTRSRAGVSLTRHGDVFLHFAEMSLASLLQAVAGVEDLAGQGRARLAVGALPSVAAGLMPAVATHFAELSSSTTLQIMDGPHGYLIDRLRRGDLDIVIGRLGPSDSMQNISFTQLYNEEVRFIVRAGHPLLAAPELPRIPEYQVIYPSQGSAIRPLVERFLISHGIGRIDKRLETVSGAFGRVFYPTVGCHLDHLGRGGRERDRRRSSCGIALGHVDDARACRPDATSRDRAIATRSGVPDRFTQRDERFGSERVNARPSPARAI